MQQGLLFQIGYVHKNILCKGAGTGEEGWGGGGGRASELSKFGQQSITNYCFSSLSTINEKCHSATYSVDGRLSLSNTGLRQVFVSNKVRRLNPEAMRES